MPQEGMLLQLDGSHHLWLEDRGPWLTLLLAVDDATGTVPYALIQEQEDTRGYLSLLQGIIERQGVPMAVYTDGHAVFQSRRGASDQSPVSQKGPSTQWGRALEELGITQIWAHSPEAKGRVERANGTFQDRLVAELRLAGACTLEETNQVLAEFLPRFNQRFGVPADEPELAYRPVDPELDLGGVLCIKELRRVAKDNTVQYHGRTLQLYPGTERPRRRGAGGDTGTSGRSFADTASEPDSNSPGSSGSCQRVAGSGPYRSGGGNASRPGSDGLGAQATCQSPGDSRATGRRDHMV